MLQTLSYKTKLWIFISIAAIAVLAAMAIFVFQGTLLKGELEGEALKKLLEDPLADTRASAALLMERETDSYVIYSNNDLINAAIVTPQRNVPIFSIEGQISNPLALLRQIKLHINYDSPETYARRSEINNFSLYRNNTKLVDVVVTLKGDEIIFDKTSTKFLAPDTTRSTFTVYADITENFASGSFRVKIKGSETDPYGIDDMTVRSASGSTRFRGYYIPRDASSISGPWITLTSQPLIRNVADTPPADADDEIPTVTIRQTDITEQMNAIATCPPETFPANIPAEHQIATCGLPQGTEVPVAAWTMSSSDSNTELSGLHIGVFPYAATDYSPRNLATGDINEISIFQGDDLLIQNSNPVIRDIGNLDVGFGTVPLKMIDLEFDPIPMEESRPFTMKLKLSESTNLDEQFTFLFFLDEPSEDTGFEIPKAFTLNQEVLFDNEPGTSDWLAFNSTYFIPIAKQDDEGIIIPPGATSILTVSSRSIPSVTHEILPETEIEVLRFDVKTDNALDLRNFAFRLSDDSTLQRSYFESIRLVKENATLLSQNGQDLSGFHNLGKLTMIIPFARRNLPADQQETYSLFATLASDAPANDTFTIVLEGIETSPEANVVNLPLRSSSFTVAEEPPPPPPPPPEDEVVEDEIDEEAAARQERIAMLQEQIETLQQQLTDAVTRRDANAQQQLTDTLQALIAAQNEAMLAAATSRVETPNVRTLIPTDPLLGLEMREEEVETLRGPFAAEQEIFAPIAQFPQPESQLAFQQAQVFEQPSLVSSARLRSAPERGDTGPGLLIYIGILTVSQGAYLLHKRKKQ